MNTPAVDDVSRRRPVWEAMSAFFLDTDLDDAQLREIADVCRASRFTATELDDILTSEIAPLLYPNLRSFAGVWDGFDVAWIEEQILDGRHLRIRKWYNRGSRVLCNWIVRGVRRQYWHRVLELVARVPPPYTA